ncbi:MULTISPECIES: VirB4 family type IV secretion/conjugal transfer ATPase [unclassified Novosphingobium]|uniref:VirB4 family type IV secretion/conjugal transfer ATPase n=1 Tax=unclassified Novosphingobium TaxID=2644732 RepID=UPI000EEDA51F|nr:MULTISPECIES: VirB4 family type IV secretion/conjugal transfer ATPase [unclassified Novosphingobium]HCF24237.1 VirB4 family type IV secretion/conjugal transfer ATPase [Novosphingobium sp.]HQV02517.1 VirB4 family type IV secretion/conjugal transfer ATPase [Novosphingobium sp.]
MQLLPALTNDPRVIGREQTAGKHLPFARHVDDVTIETRDGLLFQTVRLGGLLFETADTDEINYRAELRDATLKAVGSSRFAIYHHVIRRKAEVTLDSRFQDEFSRHLDARWRERLAAREMYVNELFLTIVRRPLQGRVGLLDWLRGLAARTAADRAANFAQEKRALDAASDAVMAALGAYRPRLLSVYQGEDGYCSESLEFLSYLFNGEMRPVLLPHGDLGEHLPFRRASFGAEAYELGAAGPCKRRFGALVSIKDYPSETLPGMFDELYRMPFEMTVSQSFAFVERAEALNRMNLVLRRMRSAEDEALSLRDELTRAKDDVAAGRAGFGEHHTTIAVHADSIEALNGQVAEVVAALADLGIVAVREDIALEPAFWAQFPGNFRYIARKGLVSTANFAGLASLHNFPVGQARGNHWGDAVTLFETTAAGPYFFNFHQNDLGNFTVIGPSGSGKTVVLNFLLAQARKFAPRIVFFDKDRGAELFIRAVGGQYDRLRPGEPSGLNPLQMDDHPTNRQFLIDWLVLLAGGADPGELELIKDAVDANFAQPRPLRRLSHLVQLLRGATRPKAGDLYARMRPWWGEGERAWLFDNAEDLTDLTASTVGFDMTALLDDPAVRTPALFYFFHRVEDRLDGTPSIIVVDEGWKALDDEVFVRRIKDWEKTIRKRNGIVGFATQSAQDALESKIASAIVEQAATQIFMINPKARAEDYVDGFGLTPHEYELVRTLPDSSHCFLIKHGNESVVARLNLSGEKDLLTILSGREATVRLFDELSAGTGLDPTAWMKPLLERAP